MGLAYQGRQYRHFIATYRPGQFESLTQRHMFVNRGFVLHRRIYGIVNLTQEETKVAPLGNMNRRHHLVN
jgi:hypothetical protein